MSQVRAILEVEMRRDEAISTLDAQLSEFEGMILPLGSGGKAIKRSGRKLEDGNLVIEIRVACCGFISRENSEAFAAQRGSARDAGGLGDQ